MKVDLYVNHSCLTGKTPCSALSLGPLLRIEEEDMIKYDADRKASKKRRTGATGDSRFNQPQNNADNEEDDHQETTGKDDTLDKKETTLRHSSQFHAKTRVVEGITPEAIYLLLFCISITYGHLAKSYCLQAMIETLRFCEGALLLTCDG